MSPRLVGATLALLVGATQLAGASADAAARHADSAHSIATFSVKHLVIANVQGTMKIVSVSLPLQPNSVIPASVDAVLDVGSVNTQEAARDKDLRCISSARASNRGAPNAFRAFGTLSLRGVSKDVTIDVAYAGDVRNAHGVQHYACVASTTLDRRDFGLNVLDKTPAGDLLVGTSVAVTINLDMVESR